MNETDLSRWLPLLVIWVVWMLISRRRRSDQEEPAPVQSQDEEGWTEQDWGEEEAAGLPAAAYTYSESHRPEVAPIPFSGTRKIMENEPGTGRRGQPIATPGARTAGRKIPPPDYRAGIARRELRRMIVWSEIIAPPVGLRKKEEP